MATPGRRPGAVRNGDPITPRRTAEWGVAVAEPVPFERYVFPPRPDELPPLAPPERGPYTLLLQSDLADPTSEVSATFDWPVDRRFTVQIGSQTPGSLTVLLDGVEVGTVWVWDYGGTCVAGSVDLTWDLLAEHDLTDLPGGEVTVTLRPEHFDGQWYARLHQLGHTAC